MPYFPRIRLGHFPTPLEPMHRLTAELRRSGPSPSLWIKRDDCSGLATGGNKTRKLEYLVGEALGQGADTLVTSGAVQSNHVRQTAAAAARNGMHCAVVVERAVERDDDYERSGNALLDVILGAEIVRYLPAGSDMPTAAKQAARELAAQGRTPYIVPTGGSNATGALGYVDCATEIAHHGLDVATVVHATGSAGTQAGLLAGFHTLDADINVLGISVKRSNDIQRKLVYDLTQETLRRLGHEDELPLEKVSVDDRFIGESYGVPTPGMIDAVSLVARTQGILLDPVYTGKAMAGMLAAIKDGAFDPSTNVVFLHTGGSVGLFAYRSVFSY